MMDRTGFCIQKDGRIEMGTTMSLHHILPLIITVCILSGCSTLSISYNHAELDSTLED